MHSKELTWSGSRPANIAPGETSQFSLGWSHACAQFGAKSADYYDELLVHLPGGTRLVHPSGLDRPELTCGLFEGRFMVQQKYVTPPNPLVGLHARLELPRTVHVGTTLTYVADLTNSTDHAIVLPRFCLGYLEALYPATDAHATVRYEMRLAAPTAAMRGRARVQWALEGSDLPQANAELTITG